MTAKNATRRFRAAMVGTYIDKCGNYTQPKPCVTLGKAVGVSRQAVHLWFRDFRDGRTPKISEACMRDLEEFASTGNKREQAVVTEEPNWLPPLKHNENIFDYLPDDAVGWMVWWNEKALDNEKNPMVGQFGVYDRSDYERPGSRKFKMWKLIQRWTPIVPPPLNPTMEKLNAERGTNTQSQCHSKPDERATRGLAQPEEARNGACVPARP
tara:strand:+ start:1922 stop:2554 length:633 start_codon:yes stop_codon:yes gene_type:complete